MDSRRRWIIARLVAVLVLLAVLGGCSAAVAGEPTPAAGGRENAKLLPSEDNPDPSKDIEDIERIEYKPNHAAPGQRVAYKQSPPFGGAHDQVWADCNGIVYEKAVRNEHMVHSLEHGAVWIAYNPDEVTEQTVATLAAKVDGQPHMMMSPYPGLSRPISLQSWGHRLMLDDAADARIDQFILALRENPYTAPEPGGSCDTVDPTVFDPADPPPFDPSPPGPDAFPEDGG